MTADIHEFRGRENRIHCRRDSVDLRNRTDTEKARADTEDREEDSEPFHVPAESFPDTVLDVVERATENLAVAADRAVFDSENAFRVLGRHAEEGGEFHPEKGARSAGSDGRCDTDDVTRSDGRGECRAKGAETGNFAFAVFFVVDDKTQCVVQVQNLKTAESNGEQNADEKDDGNQGNSPDEAIDGIQKLIQRFHGGSLYFSAFCIPKRTR